MQYFNPINCKSLHPSTKVLNQTAHPYTDDCRLNHWKCQSDEAFIEANSALNKPLQPASTASYASVKKCAPPQLEKKKKRGSPLAVPLPEPSPSLPRSTTRSFFQKEGERGLSPLLSRSSFLERRCYFYSLAQSRLYQEATNYLPVPTPGRTIPRHTGKIVNRLMRHGKKGIAIGLLAHSLLLFFKRLQDNKYTASRGGQPRISPPREFVGAKTAPSFPFFMISASTESETREKLLPPQALSGYPQNRAFSLHVDQGVLGEPSSLRKILHGEVWTSGKASPTHSVRIDGWVFLNNAHPAVNTSWYELRNSFYINLWQEKGWRCLPYGGDDTSNKTVRGIGNESTRMPLANRPRKISFAGQDFYKRRFKAPKEAASHLHAKALLLVPSSLQEGTGKGVLFSRASAVVPDRPQKKIFVIDYLEAAIANIEPNLEVRRKKIAGITRQIPSAVPKSRGERLAIRWIVESARDKARKRGKNLSECLADELIDAYASRGEPRLRRDSSHRQAESNRSFLRYRWW